MAKGRPIAIVQVINRKLPRLITSAGHLFTFCESIFFPGPTQVGPAQSYGIL